MVDIVIQFKNGKQISFIEEGTVWYELQKAKTENTNFIFNNIWFIDCKEISCMWRKGV